VERRSRVRSRQGDAVIYMARDAKAFTRAHAPAEGLIALMTTWRITTKADDLVEGLFGQVFLFVFEVLPWLERHGVQPQWAVRSRLYSDAPEYLVIPGVIEPLPASGKPGELVMRMPLLLLRTWAVDVLGNDWQALNRLWTRFFRIPERIVVAAEEVALGPAALGVHYRGTDKNRAALDTNPVSHEDMLVLMEGFLGEVGPIDTLFVATDEHDFVLAVRDRFPSLRLLNLGPIPFHKDGGGAAVRAERAVLDCVLLSRCAHVLKCSSALSGFAKVLNPDLDIRRVAASKQFTDVPYFPDAYIPPLRSKSPASCLVLERLMAGDWLSGPYGPSTAGERFCSRARFHWRRRLMNLLKYAVSRLRPKRRTK
jgi:hypothetical protein